MAVNQAKETGRGEAGRGGEDVRSDAHVAVRLLDRGKLDIHLTSRVEPYYGDSLRGQASSILRLMGVQHARVDIKDQGALPFVIAARLEAALRSAGCGESGDARPERTAEAPAPSGRERLRRSRLYLPGNEPKFMINAGIHEPDGIILDLEDSVHHGAKLAARLLVRNALRCVDFGSAERMVRINQLPTGLEDLEEIVPESADLILIPKTEGPAQIAQVDEAIERIQGGGEGARPLWLMPILESALGIENAFAIARASKRVAALTLGLEDLTADLGVAKSREGVESLYARMRVVNAAKAAGIQAIDSVYGDVDDIDGLRAWGERSRRLGFEGMGCVHPRQIRIVHESFAPSPSEIEKALAIVAAFEEAQARGLAVVSLASKMIDPPVVERARRLVDRARVQRLAARDGDEGAG